LGVKLPGREAIPPLPNTASWRGAQLKSTGTTSTFTLLRRQQKKFKVPSDLLNKNSFWPGPHVPPDGSWHTGRDEKSETCFCLCGVARLVNELLVVTYCPVCGCL